MYVFDLITTKCCNAAQRFGSHPCVLSLYAAGSCSAAQTEAISQLQPETSVSCHLSFTSDAIDFPANDVFKTHTSFDRSSGKADQNSVPEIMFTAKEAVRLLYRL